MDEDRKSADGIIKQHENVREQVDQLRQFLEPPRPEIGEGGRAWGSDFTEHLTRVHGTISRHFRFEEKTGLFAQIEKDHPHTTHQVAALARDHDRILSDLRAILVAAMTYSEGRLPENPQLRRWTTSVLDQLSEHEREETALLQRAYGEDIGGSG